MKLLIITAIAEFEKPVSQMLKQAQIEAFSSSDIEGHKNINSMVNAQNWYSSGNISDDSLMIFSFTGQEQIDEFMSAARAFNEEQKTQNRIRAVVLPIEQHL